jgi:DNA sulfur modification protein DndB
LIVIKRDEPQKEFLESYRRLFSALNRYAKPTDADTNIIMDEDDTFAILTRRLISEHPFFQWADGKQVKSARVKMKGKNLKEGDSYFTSLQTLYAINQILLSSEQRQSVGWGTGDQLEKDVNTFKRFRPEEEYLESLYVELVSYWDGILNAVSELKENPETCREHQADGKEKERDLLLFWPIGQELFASVARSMLDQALENKEPTKENVAKALSALGKMQWDLHEVPWRYFILTQKDDSWKMRSEGRKEAIDLAEKMLRWIVGRDKLSAEDKLTIKKQWLASLTPSQKEDEEKKLWAQVEKLPDAVRGK